MVDLMSLDPSNLCTYPGLLARSGWTDYGSGTGAYSVLGGQEVPAASRRIRVVGDHNRQALAYIYFEDKLDGDRRLNYSRGMR
jgi:hypothetical protein